MNDCALLVFAETSITDERWFGPVFMIVAGIGAVVFLILRDRGKREIPWRFVAVLAIALPVVAGIYFIRPDLEVEHPHYVIILVGLGAVSLVGAIFEVVRMLMFRRRRK